MLLFPKDICCFFDLNYEHNYVTIIMCFRHSSINVLINYSKRTIYKFTEEKHRKETLLYQKLSVAVL